MTQNILIGIGGTGARVVESMIHLCAAGYGPDNLTLFIIDPDEGNGNLTRTKTLVTLYDRCRKNYSPVSRVERVLFKTQIKTPGTMVWKIFEDKNSTLSYYINHKTLPQDLHDFATILFSDAELNTPLNEGFRGHPSIGAVVMANPPEDEEPWTILWDEIADKKANDVRVFLAGSVFGGTGAAGVPTIGSRDLIKFNPKAKVGANKSRVLLGGALVMPYFSFEKKDETDEKMFVTNHDFPIATKAALHYYNEKELGFDQLYLLGDSLNQKVGKFSVGSQSQENQPHYIEIATALAANDFFDQPPIEGDPEKLYFIACRNDEKVDWEALPISRDEHQIRNRQVELKSRLVTMTTFAYALGTYGNEILEREHKSIEDTWYREHFKYKEKKEKDRVKNPRWGENKAALDIINEYNRRYFLPWICSLDDLSGRIAFLDRQKICVEPIQIGKDLDLIDYNRFPSYIGDFLAEKSKAFDFGFFIRNSLNAINLTGEKTLSASDKYLNLFYNAAEKFCAENYNIE